MKLSADEWTLVLADPATNYHTFDHAVGLVMTDTAPTSDQPVLLVDAMHIETDVTVRLTLRIPVEMIPALAGEFTALHSELRSRGAVS